MAASPQPERFRDGSTGESESINLLTAQVARLEAELAEQRDTDRSLNHRLAQQEAQIRDLKRQIQDVTQSRLWRILVYLGGLVLECQGIIGQFRSRIQSLRAAPEIVYITCDSPSPTSSATLFGTVLIQGWTVAQSGVKQVKVGIAGGPKSNAAIGLLRKDVHNLYSQFPGSENSGFRAQLDLSDLPDGDQTLYIETFSRRGTKVRSEYQIRVDGRATARPRSEQESRKLVASMQHTPLISFVMPVFDTPEKWLRRCLDSVLRQHYPNWELCIANDASPAPHIRGILEEYKAKDKRVKVIHCERHGHIARASNAALGLVKGEYVALLDHDDEVTADALVEIALTINRNPSADMIYSDEDKIDENNIRSDPFYKPDWSPEFFETCMYTCHLGVYRTSLIRELGGFRPEVTGAQDYDLALRVVSRTDEIYHVQKVLYHWRTLPSSTASGGEAKDYAYSAAQNALRNYLEIQEIAGEVVSGPRLGYHRIRFRIPGELRVSVVIPTAGRTILREGRRIDLLRACVESITSKSTWRNLEIIAVDNGDLSGELKEFLFRKRVQCVTDSGPGFNLARKMNLGAEKASGDHLVFLNDDTEVISPDWIENLLQYSHQPQIGAVGAKLLFPNGRIQHAGVVILGGNPGHAYYNHPAEEVGYYLSAQVPRNYLAVTGACMMTRASLFRELGGFDLEFPLNFNDVDYCLRVHQTRLRIVYTPYAELYHYESVTREGAGSVGNHELELFHERWLKKYYLDPYYSPNLPSDYPYYRVEN